MPDADPTNLVTFFGRMHPLVVHLPIGLLVALAVLEVARWFKRWRGAAEARTVLLGLLVVSSVAAVVFGLMLEEEGGYSDDLLFWHKWMGIGMAGGCIATACAFWAKKRWMYGSFLLVTLALLIPSTHFGGSMTHGSDYLVAYAPRFIRDFARGPVGPTTQPANAMTVAATQPADPHKAVAYTALVRPMLAKYCASCHGGDKIKGDLRLDTIENMLKGGESGPAIVPGNSKDSLLLTRVLLPMDDEDDEHMPPEDKPQPTPEQIALLKWWVDAGASPDKTVEQLAPPPQVMAHIVATLGAPASASALAATPTTAPAASATVARAPDPAPIDSLAGDIARLSKDLGIVIEQVAMEQPWLAINASIARSFGDEQLAQLKPLASNVQVLNVAGTQVTDSGLPTIAAMPHLQRLRLERTKVTDAGMVHLAKLEKLEYLNLYGNEITDAGLKPLESLPALRQVYLWRTKVDPAAAQAFADAMVDQAKIEELRKQIAQLQAQIKAEQVEVVQGVLASTQPTSAPASAPVVATAAAAGATPTTTTAPTTAAVAAAPVNTECPVSGKPIDPTKFVEFEGKRVAFCCDNCPKAFKEDPAKYKAKLNLAAVAPAPAPASAPATAPTTAAAVVAVNTTCPVSGKPIDATKFIDFDGKRIAFCCGNCPGAFKADPAKFKDKLK